MSLRFCFSVSHQSLAKIQLQSSSTSTTLHQVLEFCGVSITGTLPVRIHNSFLRCNATLFKNLWISADQQLLYCSFSLAFLSLRSTQEATTEGESGFLVLHTSDTLEIQHRSLGGMDVNNSDSKRKERGTSALGDLCQIILHSFLEFYSKQVTVITCTHLVLQLEKNKTGNRKWFVVSFCQILNAVPKCHRVTWWSSGLGLSGMIGMIHTNQLTAKCFRDADRTTGVSINL